MIDTLTIDIQKTQSSKLNQVDFDNMMARLGAYKKHEDDAHEACHLEMQIREKEHRTSNSEH